MAHEMVLKERIDGSNITVSTVWIYVPIEAIDVFPVRRINKRPMTVDVTCGSVPAFKTQNLLIKRSGTEQTRSTLSKKQEILANSNGHARRYPLFLLVSSCLVGQTTVFGDLSGWSIHDLVPEDQH